MNGYNHNNNFMEFIKLWEREQRQTDNRINLGSYQTVNNTKNANVLPDEFLQIFKGLIILLLFKERRK